MAFQYGHTKTHTTCLHTKTHTLLQKVPFFPTPRSVVRAPPVDFFVVASFGPLVLQRTSINTNKCLLLLLFGYSCHKNKNKITSVHAWLVIVSQKEKEKKRNETKRNETKRNTNFSADLVGRGTTTAATATVAPGLLRRRHAPLQA